MNLQVKQSQLKGATAGPGPVPVRPLPSPRVKKSVASTQSVPLPDYLSTSDHEYEEIVNVCSPKGHHTLHSHVSHKHISDAHTLIQMLL